MPDPGPAKATSATAAPAGDSASPGEGAKERRDRELSELLSEVRIALPGVQVLFAFLLVLPFQSRFAALGGIQRDVYVGALLFAAAAIALLIAPSSYHRINFRAALKERMLQLSNRLLIGGLACIAVSVTLSVGLVVDVVLDPGLAIVAAVATGLWFGWFWFAIPLLARRERDAPADQPG
ncbi:MAG: DUF6328 family protein [Chloroflexota bacterium]